MMTVANEMKARLRADLKSAMIARRSPEVATLRSLIAAIDNAEAPALAGGRIVHAEFVRSAEIERLELNLADIEAILSAQLVEREQATRACEARGMFDRVDALCIEMDIIRTYSLRDAGGTSIAPPVGSD